MKNNEQDIRIVFADRLKELRLNKGLTQTELANMAKIIQQTIALYEKGKRLPKADELVSLAYALNTTPNDLLRFEQKKLSAISILFSRFAAIGISCRIVESGKTELVELRYKYPDHKREKASTLQIEKDKFLKYGVSSLEWAEKKTAPLKVSHAMHYLDFTIMAELDKAGENFLFSDKHILNGYI